MPADDQARLDFLMDQPEKAANTLQCRWKANMRFAPFSLSEARLDENEYLCLRSWATNVPQTAFERYPRSTGLLLLALLAEWNRRESIGDAVFKDVPKLFGDRGTRDFLFDANDNPRSRTRDTIEETSRRFELRQAFDCDDIEHFWYVTIQLQYGFSRSQIDQIPSWLGGQPTPKSVSFLRESITSKPRSLGSRTFQTLFQTLRDYREDSLTESEVRRRLSSNPWILPEWIPRILAAAGRKSRSGASSFGDGQTAAANDPAHRGRIKFDLFWGENGPAARIKPPDQPWPAEAPRYVLSRDQERLATWFLEPGEEPASRYRLEIHQPVLDVRRPELLLNVANHLW